MFEIIFTFAKDSDIQKIRIGESFEYLSHLQRFRHSKDSTQNFFPNLSNVLNILLTSLFLQKIQIFERFNSGESLVNLLVNLFGESFAKDSDIRKIRIGESFEYLSHLQRFGHSKDSTQNFFPNLSNVLNILLTSLFLQKIQIFERFNFCKRFGHSKDSSQIFSRIFRMF